jgi:hypothetical protein
MDANPLPQLTLEIWYKLMIAVGFILVILSLTTDLKFDNLAIFAMGWGFFFAGSGEWINHPRHTVMQTVFGHPMMGTGVQRINQPLGVSLDAFGLLLLVFSVYQLVISLP